MTETVELQRETGFHLVATDRPQLEAAHQQMIEWARAQMKHCDAEQAEEEKNLQIAESKHWSTAPFRRRVNLLAKRRVFYEKIELALQAGYVIVPGFQMNVFAIRTNAKAPKHETSDTHWARFPQSAQLLPPGEGEYKNPLPEVYQSKDETTRDGKPVTVTTYFPENWQDIEFPIALARPVLMERTAEAMALKLFDEIGVAVDAGSSIGRGKGDPIILGRLRNPAPSRPDLTFFIGWYFDPSRL